MKPVIKLIDDPEVIKVAVENAKREILSMLTEQEMTVSEIAARMKKDISTVYRHVHQLQEVGLIEVTGEKKVHHIPEKVYGRTAKILLYSPEVAEMMGDRLREEHILPNVHILLEMMKELGYEVDDSDEFRENLRKMVMRFNMLTAEGLQRISSDKEKDIPIPMYILLMLAIGLIHLDIDPDLTESVRRFISGVRMKK